MNGHARVAAFPPEQAQHPGWRALPPPGLQAPRGAFFWIGERRAPELAILRTNGAASNRSSSTTVRWLHW